MHSKDALGRVTFSVPRAGMLLAPIIEAYTILCPSFAYFNSCSLKSRSSASTTWSRGDLSRLNDFLPIEVTRWKIVEKPFFISRQA